MSEQRVLDVQLGFKFGMFDYNIYETTEKTGLLKKLKNTIENSKRTDINFKPKDTDYIDGEIIDYGKLLQYNKMQSTRGKRDYYSGAFGSSQRVFTSRYCRMAENNDLDSEEFYITKTIRQLQLVLNQPYINIKTNKIFRLYQLLDMNKTQRNKISFNLSRYDIPLYVFHDIFFIDLIWDNERTKAFFKKYKKEDIYNVLSTSQRIKKLTQHNVCDILQMIDTTEKKDKISYYKNNRNKFEIYTNMKEELI